MEKTQTLPDPKTFPPPKKRIAVLIPCYNEEKTVAQVVSDFRNALPEADIYVFDNASNDKTTEAATRAGAVVVPSPQRGKGNVVRHMFETIEADWYLMVDGDATYPAGPASEMLEIAERDRLDMLAGHRVTPEEELGKAYRPLHQAGNAFLCWVVRKTFEGTITDIFTGYRIFSRSFVKSVPLHAKGFQIEAEMTMQALSKGFRVAEFSVPYGARPEGSVSKLNTYRDGFLVVATLGMLYRSYRPGLFFFTCGLLLVVCSLLAGVGPVWDYLQYHYVYRVPLAVLAVGLAVLSALSFAVGLILQTQLRYHNELHKLLRSTLPG